jgi:uncharacterized membrane protein
VKALSQRFLQGVDIWTAVFLGALVSGAILRFRGLGRYGFWTDELFHVFAAASYLRDGSFSVPWLDAEYTRALPITLITAFGFKLFGESEASARFFFALTNVVFIAVGYLAIRHLLSRATAVVFAVAMSFSVFAIQMSQECRMYTVFQLFYFMMSVAFLRGFEQAPQSPWLKGGNALWSFQRRQGVSVVALGAALAFGFVAASVQRLVYNFAFVVAVYCVVMSCREWSRSGWRTALRSKYGVTLGVGAFALAVVVVVSPEWLAGLLRRAAELPPFQQSAGVRFAFYQKILQEPHAVLWALLPLGMFTAVYRHGRVGLFFVLSFLIPFALHSFLFQRRAERYIFHLLPFFIAISATAVVFLAEAVKERVGKLLRELSRPGKWALIASGCVSAAWIAYPMLHATVADSSVAKFQNWKNLDPEMLLSVSSSTAITTDRWGFNYYFKQYPDFVLGVEDLPGDKILRNVEEFAEVVRRYPDVSLVTYRAQFYNDVFVSAQIREYVQEEMERIDDGQDDARIMVFRSRR